MSNTISTTTPSTAADSIIVDLLRASQYRSLDFLEARVDALRIRTPQHAATAHYKLHLCKALIAFRRRNFRAALSHIQLGESLAVPPALHYNYDRLKTHILVRASFMLGQIHHQERRNQKTRQLVKSGSAILIFSALCLAAGLVAGTQAYHLPHREVLIALATGCLYAWGISLCVAIYHFIRSLMRIIS